MKFTNTQGKSGMFSFDGRKYSFKDGVFECKKEEKDLIVFLKDSTAWTDYKPTAEDKVKDYTAEIKKLKAENEALLKDLDEATKVKK